MPKRNQRLAVAITKSYSRTVLSGRDNLKAFACDPSSAVPTEDVEEEGPKEC